MGYHESWYHNQIMYCLDVETFVDSNGDGIGDFRGLTSRLDYLAGLGVTVSGFYRSFRHPTAMTDTTSLISRPSILASARCPTSLPS